MALIISNTEITAKNLCHKQHDYMYNQEIEPREYPLAIRRGQIGHIVLERYYICRMAGMSHDSSTAEAKDLLFQLIAEADPSDIDNTQMLGHLSWLLLRYFNYCRRDTFIVIDVECLKTASMTDSITFGVYLDLLVEITTGPFKGQFEIWDHKFVSNFKSVKDLTINGQQPKYLKTARENGYPIRQAIFNQLRYRSMKNPTDDDLFRRSPLMANDTAVENVWDEAIDTAQEIESGVVKTRRTLAYGACKFCWYADLCMTELAGEPSDIMRKMQYQPRKRPLKDWMLSNA